MISLFLYLITEMMWILIYNPLKFILKVPTIIML